MTKVIYSVYIDIPEAELDYQPPHWGTNISKTLHTKLEFQKNYSWLKQNHKLYANKIQVEYKLFEYDNEYKKYHKWFKKTYPQITSYNIVNFYKLYILYELAKNYDEILYLDFDVIPIKYISFFDIWDLSKGIAILSGTQSTQNDIESDTIKSLTYKREQSIRSPLAKYWNAYAMLQEESFNTSKCDVFNTGIIGANKYWLDQLDYFNEFDKTLKLMKYLITEKHSMYPKYIQNMFGYDNETIWAYNLLSKELPYQNLSPEWHHFMDKWSYIPENTIFVHAINKNFSYVKEWIETNK
jgi:hypothetical protein